MELFNQDDVKELIKDMYFKLQDKGAIPDFLSFESFFKSWKRDRRKQKSHKRFMFVIFSKARAYRKKQG